MGFLPAAKKGDRVVGIDTHIVMVPTSGGPVPTPLPHPFNGIIDNKLSNDVYIMRQPAATKESMATNTPSHIPTPPGTSFQTPPSNKAEIFMGSTTVYINGKPAARMTDIAKSCNDPQDMPVSKVVVPFSTVYIGGAMGMGGGAKVEVEADAEAEVSGVEAIKISKEEAEKKEEEEEKGKHWIEFIFKDPQGKPISGKKYQFIYPDGTKEEGTLGSDGRIRKDGIDPGSCSVLFEGLHDARWSKSQISPSEPVELLVDTLFCKDGTEVSFDIYREFKETSKDKITALGAKSKDGIAKTKWQYEYDQKDEGKIARFIFKAQLGDDRAISNVLEVGDEIEIVLVDKDGNPVPWRKYILITSDDKEREGHSDSNGKIRQLIPIGKCKFRLKDGAKFELR